MPLLWTKQQFHNMHEYDIIIKIASSLLFSVVNPSVLNILFYSCPRTHTFSLLKTLTDGLMDFLWIIVMFLSAFCSLILMAPIHFNGTFSKKVM